MTGVPRTTVDDGYIEGLICAVCGRPDLFVQHLPNYPDFVTCRNCEAAFVVEDTGERVMYGKIPDGYPDTTQFALRQWVWLEAVERRAVEERAAVAPQTAEASLRSALPAASAAAEPAAEAPSPPEEEPPPNWLAARLNSGMPAGVPIPTEPDPYRSYSPGVPLATDTTPVDESLPAWLRPAGAAAAAAAASSAAAAPAGLPAAPAAAPAAQKLPVAAAAAAPAPAASEGDEPPPGKRHRVVLRGDRIRVPVAACAHCQRSPAPARMPVSGNLPRADTGRRATTFQVPLCQDCRSRASRLSADQRNARVMAVLIGALVGLIAVVAVLALSIIPFAANPFVGLLILGGIWFITFSLLGGFMLARVGRLPPAPDAAFVRTTLRVAADPAGPLTAFEWRNRQTAVSFHEANAAAASAAPSVVDETASAS